MKNNFLFLCLLIILCNCSLQNKKDKNNFFYTNKGFSGKYSDIKVKESSKFYEVILNQKIPNVSLKIINPINNKNILINKIRYMKIDSANLIYLNNYAFNALKLDDNLPYVYVQSVKSNPTFVAKTAKEFKEEKKVKNISKVLNVEIIDLNKKNKVKMRKLKSIYLQFGSFYNKIYAKILNDKLNILLNFNQISIKGSKKSFNVIVGPLSMSQYKQFFKVLKKNEYENYEVLIK